MPQYIDRNLLGELVVHGMVHYENIMRIPVADVAERRSGHWIPVDDLLDAFDCEFCEAMVQKECDFCPRCGARMYPHDVEV